MSDLECTPINRTQTDAICKGLQEKEYTVALEYLQLLKKQLMSESDRLEHGPYLVEKLGQSALPPLIQALQGTTEASEPDSAALACCVECYRCMRNACAFCSPSQDALQNSVVLDRTLDLVVSSLWKWKVPDMDLLRNVMQFLTNACVGHSGNMMLVWEKFSGKFSQLIRFGDEKLTEYTSIAVHTILRGAQECSELGDLVVPGLPELASTFTHKLSKDVSGWSEIEILVLEDILTLEKTLQPVLGPLPLEEKVVMMQVVHAILSHELDQEGNPSVSNLKHLAPIFVEAVEDLMKSAPHSVENNQMKYMRLVLENLCIITSDEFSHDPYCEDQGLLESALSLLRRVHSGQKESSLYLPGLPEPDSLDSSYELKKHLVKLIGNMCYKRKANQNFVQAHDGIPLLLDLTNFDVKNPYLREWVVFAVRNLCEDNSEIQALVRNASLQSLTPEAVEYLRMQGLEGEVKGGKVTIKSISK